MENNDNIITDNENIIDEQVAEKTDIPIKRTRKSNKTWLSILAIIACLTIVFWFAPCIGHEYKEPCEKIETYQEYVTYTVQEPYTISVPYTIKEFIDEPVYKTVSHNDPKYETLYNLRLDSTTITNVYSHEKTYTGKSFWENDEYTVVVYYYVGLNYYHRTYYQITDIIVSNKHEEIVGYDYWTEEIIDYYETKEVEITEYKQEVRYKTVEKSRLEDKQRVITVYETRTEKLSVFETLDNGRHVYISGYKII